MLFSKCRQKLKFLQSADVGVCLISLKGGPVGHSYSFSRLHRNIFPMGLIRSDVCGNGLSHETCEEEKINQLRFKHSL